MKNMCIFSILSKYGVYGFPTLILLNSTMRVRYQGSRTMDSLITFYGDVTGKVTVILLNSVTKNAFVAFLVIVGALNFWVRLLQHKLNFSSRHRTQAFFFHPMRFLYESY